MATQNVNFFAPEAAQDYSQVQRQRAMAELLTKQGVTPQQGQMVGNIYVPPGAMNYVNQLAQALGGVAMNRNADAREAQLAKAMRERTVQEMNDFSTALQGTPETTREVDGPPSPGKGAPTQTIPGMAPDRARALSIALGSASPGLQSAGGKLFEQMLPKDAKWEKAEKPNADGSKAVGYVNLNSANPWSTFQEGGVAPVKLEGVNTGGNTTFINPYAPKAEGAPVVSATGNKFKDLIVDDGRGGVSVNTPLLAAKQSVAKAGAANIVNKVDVKTGESLAKEVGPILKDSADAANGAVKQIDAAQRIVKAVDSNNLYAGPLATSRLKVAQIGDMLGVGGRDEKEKIANTRDAIRGLAEMTLSGRAQMKGQGAITESESKLAEKAVSGDLNDLTAAEVKQLAKASERAARFVYQGHQRKMEAVKGVQGAQNIAPFYEAAPLPSDVQTSPAGEFKIIGVQ
jgi:hypothetical protein